MSSSSEPSVTLRDGPITTQRSDARTGGGQQTAIRRMWVSLLAVLSATAILLAGGVPAGATSVRDMRVEDLYSIQATQVTVSVSCQSDGRYAWNATMTDASSYTTYSVYYQWKHSSPTGGGGSFNWIYAGNLTTGRYGIGSSSTYYGNAGTGTTSVTITAKIAGVTGSDTDTC